MEGECTMRYLGQLGVAAFAASRADTDAQAGADRPIDSVSAGPWLLSEEQAAAWRTWAMAGPTGFGTAEVAGVGPADAGATAETGQLAARRPLGRLRE